MKTTYKLFGITVFKTVRKGSWEAYEPTTTDYIFLGLKIASRIIT